MSAYEQLEAAVSPILLHYRNDLLVHDRAAVEEHPGVPFLHWACDSHTHILFLIPPDEYPQAGKWIPYLFGQADRSHLLRQVTEMAEYFVRPTNNPDRYTVHHFTAGRLIKIDPRKAVEVAERYSRQIRHAWEVKPRLSVVA